MCYCEPVERLHGKVLRRRQDQRGIALVDRVAIPAELEASQGAIAVVGRELARPAAARRAKEAGHLIAVRRRREVPVLQVFVANLPGVLGHGQHRGWPGAPLLVVTVNDLCQLAPEAAKVRGMQQLLDEVLQDLALGSSLLHVPQATSLTRGVPQGREVVRCGSLPARAAAERGGDLFSQLLPEG